MSKILLIDDDIEFTELLTELLSLEGFEITVAHNGQIGLDKLAANAYDLILLDVMMPVLNGIETLKQIRLRCEELPVLMLSAKDDHIDRVLGLELGADDYLPKPFNDRELIARMKALLRRFSILQKAVQTEAAVDEPTSQQGATYPNSTFFGIELRSHTQQAFYKGVDLELTVTEFSVLQTLIKHKGVLITRDDLSMAILGKTLSPYDRAIDMHISNLRKKLPAREDNRPWFKTLRGKGYLLLDE